MNDDLYRKVVSDKGKVRYEPVARYSEEAVSNFPYGTHLVICRRGSTSRVYNVDTNLVPMLAAMHACIDDMSHAIYKASEARPKRVPLTPEQKEAWEKLKEVYGDEMFSIMYPSAHDVAKAGIESLYSDIEERMKIPAVKKAYEDFLFVYNVMGGHVEC